jgi:hypothetical protein
MISPDTVEYRIADPPFDNQEADVILRSSDNIDFYVFKALVSFSSSVFKDMFYVEQGQQGSGELKGGLQVIPTDDTAETWRILLRFSYPSWAVGPPALNSLDEFSKALESSRKYGMTGAEQSIVADFVTPRFVEKEPMRVFALACQYGLEPEARTAAKQTLRTPILDHPYIAEMEYLTVRIFHRLQQYHLQCGKAASKVARDTTWVAKSVDLFSTSPRIAPNYPPARHREKIMAAKWWLEYMQSAATALEDRPLGATVLDIKLMDDALENAIRSGTSSFADMREFGEFFAAEVDKAVAKASRDFSS